MKRTPSIGRTVAGAAARKAWKTRRASERPASDNAPAANSAASFRPAFASDGALLLIGATLPGELHRGELRVLLDFIRRLDKAVVA